MFNENQIKLRLWFFEITLNSIPKGSFVGKRSLALFIKNKKVFKI